MSKRPSPRDLVPLPREVKFDDTLREFTQHLRFDAVVGKPLRVQLLLDRRHKLKKRLSKPLGYFRVSQAQQLLSMASAALAMANVLSFQSHGEVPPREDIEKATLSALNLIHQDVVTLTEIELNQIKLHKMALAASLGEKVAGSSLCVSSSKAGMLTSRGRGRHEISGSRTAKGCGPPVSQPSKPR